MWPFNTNPNRKKVVIKTNVLILMGAAYFAVVFMFLVMVCWTEKLTATEAWDILEAPLMALIGGTLALSKDLIRDEDNPSEPEKLKKKSSTNDEDQGNGGKQ